MLSDTSRLARPMPTNPLILVCDDELHIRAMIVTKLRAAGLEVVEARTGEEGLALATKTAPRLIITDFQMPCMSGIEMATYLRVAPSTRDVPVIMLTARGYILSPDQLAATNIREIIPKPFGVRQLLLRVQALLADPTSGIAPKDDSKPLAA